MESKTIHILKGGNWDHGAYPEYMGFTKLEDQWEYMPFMVSDLEGLPERWLRILKGETGWIPKIVFKLKTGAKHIK